MKKKVISIVVFIIGLITLITGVVFLVINLLSSAGLEDGEYLISAKEWVLEGEQMKCKDSEDDQTKCLTEDGSSMFSETGVIWKFTEIGKGILTTNNHQNDYDFIWALEGEKMKIETEWLYTLENEYDYEIDQKEGILTLKNGEEEYKFKAEFETE